MTVARQFRFEGHFGYLIRAGPPAECWQQPIYLFSTFPKVSVICLAGRLSLSTAVLFDCVVQIYPGKPLQQQPVSVSYWCTCRHLSRKLSTLALSLYLIESSEVKCSAPEMCIGKMENWESLWLFFQLLCRYNDQILQFSRHKLAPPSLWAPITPLSFISDPPSIVISSVWLSLQITAPQINPKSESIALDRLISTTSQKGEVIPVWAQK